MTRIERLKPIFLFVLLAMVILLMIRFCLLSDEEVRQLENVYEDEYYELQ